MSQEQWNEQNPLYEPGYDLMNQTAHDDEVTEEEWIESMEGWLDDIDVQCMSYKMYGRITI